VHAISAASSSILPRCPDHRASGVVAAFAGTAPVAGVVSNARQLSRSLVSAALQLGGQIDGSGVCRALSGSGASMGGGTIAAMQSVRLAPNVPATVS